MILTVDYKYPTHISYLHAFAKASNIPFFRYFQTRTVEEAIQTHKLTLLDMDSEHVRGYAHIDWNQELQRYFIALCTLPPYQHCGIGKGLLRELLSYADIHGFPLYLSVDKENHIAQTLYKKEGFYMLEEKPHFFFYKREIKNQTTMPVIIEVPVSLGEALDKLTILDIKLEKIQNESKRVDCKKEQLALLSKLEDYVQKYLFWYTVLKGINAEIWSLQDVLRVTENKDDLARYVLDLNDTRFRIKNKINLWSSSSLKEQKGYKQKNILLEHPFTLKEAFHFKQVLNYLSIEYDTVYCRLNDTTLDVLFQPNILVLKPSDTFESLDIATVYTKPLSDAIIDDLHLCKAILPSLLPTSMLIKTVVTLDDATRYRSQINICSNNVDELYLFTAGDAYSSVSAIFSDNHKIKPIITSPQIEAIFLQSIENHVSLDTHPI